jgi:hypothetical protein
MSMRVVAVLGVLLCLAAQANDASFVGDGATVYTNKDTRIRMVKETIRISYYPEGKNQRRWRADCVFEFENLTDASLSITMGFPNWSTMGDDVGADMALREFVTEIDGKEVKTESKSISKDKLAAPWKSAGKLATFDGAIVWPVELGPKAKVTVRNRFAFGGFSSNGPFDVLQHMPPTYPKIRKQHTFWSVRKPGKKDIDFANALVNAVAYITTTGLTWKGPIDEADIRIELPPVLRENPHYAIPLPVGYRMDATSVAWTFKNYRPTEELTLYYLGFVVPPEDATEETKSTGFEYRSQAEAWVKFASKSSIAPEVVDRLITLTRDPGAKEVLAKFKESTKDFR